jgi:large subunit ribosomal protein L25
MAETVVLTTEKRDRCGSHAASRLRKKGQIPAVIYGHKEENEHVSLVGEDFVKALRHGARVVDLQTERGVQKVLIREIQWDHLGKEVLHVDFARVSADERYVVSVPIELRGIAPGVAGGGVLDQPLHTIEVECLAIAIPDSIRVSIAELQVGGSIHVRDLKLPEGVVAMTDADAIVVHVTTPQAEPEAPVEAAATGTEPEVIGRKAAEEGEAEE